MADLLPLPGAARSRATAAALHALHTHRAQSGICEGDLEVQVWHLMLSLRQLAAEFGFSAERVWSDVAAEYPEHHLAELEG
jgi:hypothetical protein